MRDRLEVDLNFMFRIPLFPSERRPVKALMPNVEIRVPLVSWPELVAGKCVAALDRAAPRDVYDLAHMRPQLDLADPAIRAACIGLSAVLPHPLSTYDKRRFHQVDREQMDVALRPFLRQRTRDDLDAILPAADALLVWLLNLNEKETCFVDGIATGHIQPELLLPGDAAFCRALRQHPALLWKTKNVLEHRKKR